jgi:hypothetical protein
MKQDCWICVNSIGSGNAREMIFRGYRDGYADTRKGVSIVCERHKVVNSEPRPGCGFEREAGADDV